MSSPRWTRLCTHTNSQLEGGCYPQRLSVCAVVRFCRSPLDLGSGLWCRRCILASSFDKLIAPALERNPIIRSRIRELAHRPKRTRGENGRRGEEERKTLSEEPKCQIFRSSNFFFFATTGCSVGNTEEYGLFAPALSFLGPARCPLTVFGFFDLASFLFLRWADAAWRA